jgi:large subunit ribosomal protein L22
MDSLLVKSHQISISPRKMLLITELIRNKDIISSLYYLQSAPQKSSRIIYKILNGAYKQLINDNKNNEDFFNKVVYISLIKVDKGKTTKKIFIRAKGRADMTKRRKCHLTISLSAK